MGGFSRDLALVKERRGEEGAAGPAGTVFLLLTNTWLLVVLAKEDSRRSFTLLGDHTPGQSRASWEASRALSYLPCRPAGLTGTGGPRLEGVPWYHRFPAPRGGRHPQLSTLSGSRVDGELESPLQD